MGDRMLRRACERSRSLRKKVGHFLRIAADLLEQPDLRIRSVRQRAGLVSWRRAQGDKSLRLAYDLNPTSVVFDLGGYEGQWASDIFAMYGCAIHVFEPVPEFARKIETRFARNAKITLHRFGLSNKTAAVRLSLNADGSSIFGAGAETMEVELVEAQAFLGQAGIARIDLMKINIEGAEYDLLDHLLDCGFVRQLGNIQVQFHDLLPDAEERMTQIQQRLQATHRLTYQFPFVWENWERRARDDQRGASTVLKP